MEKGSKVRTTAQVVQSAAIAATGKAISAGADYEPLIAVIDRDRTVRRGRGRPPLWVTQLREESSAELAAAILYAIVESRLWVESQPGSNPDSPLVSSVAGRLGRNLGLGSDELGLQIGGQLLHLAALAGIIAPFLDGDDEGRRVVLLPATRQRLAVYVNGSGAAVRRLVRTVPPRGVSVKLRHDMKEERQDAPPRVEEAADKVQGTAWRINTALLDTMLSRVTLSTPLEELLALQQAQALRARPKFYLPVGLDFRGRLYQRGKFLTYTSGGDLARGLLEFAEGEPVDDAGIGWIAYHLAQMTGQAGPAEFGNGRAWLLNYGRELMAHGWTEAKERTHALAARAAFSDAILGKPVHLPIRLDATCSGLQHIAWLTRDKELAQLVNLWGDTYTTAQKLAAKATAESPDFYAYVAQSAGTGRDQGKAGLVPTFYGAAEYTCAEALAALRGKNRLVVTDAARGMASPVRTQARIHAQVAFRIVHDLDRVPLMYAGDAIEWETPTGFRVVQDYRADWSRVEPVRTVIEGQRIGFPGRRAGSRIDGAPQRQACAADLVHSMDAAMLAELVAAAPAESWAVAHDAFAVLPGQVPALLDCLPDVIRDMYGPDRLPPPGGE